MSNRLTRRDMLRLGAGLAGTLPRWPHVRRPAQPRDSAAGESAAGSEAAGERTQIRFASFDWFANVPGVQWAEYHQNEAFPRYYEEHPDVEILWEPHGDGWSTKVLTNMAAGTAPDVMSTWPPIINTWAEKQQLLDLQPLVDQDIPDADDIFLAAGWDQCWDQITQIRMAMVTNIDVTSVYYSKPAFDELGVAYPKQDWTVEDCAQTACELTKRDDDGEITRWGGQLRPSYVLGYFYYVEAWGGMVRDDDTLMNCMLGEEEALQAFEWIRHNMWDLNCLAQRNQVNASGIPNTWTGVCCRPTSWHSPNAAPTSSSTWPIRWRKARGTSITFLRAPSTASAWARPTSGASIRASPTAAITTTSGTGSNGSARASGTRITSPAGRAVCPASPAPPTSGLGSCARSTAASDRCSWR